MADVHRGVTEPQRLSLFFTLQCLHQSPFSLGCFSPIMRAAGSCTPHALLSPGSLFAGCCLSCLPPSSRHPPGCCITGQRPITNLLSPFPVALGGPATSPCHQWRPRFSCFKHQCHTCLAQSSEGKGLSRCFGCVLHLFLPNHTGRSKSN